MASEEPAAAGSDTEIAVTVTEEKRPKRNPSRLMMAVLYLVGGFVSLTLFDHFGLEEASTGQIQDGINRVVADRYPAKPTDASRGVHGAAPPKVALVLWDDADLTAPATATTWPVTYERHAQVLERIAAGKPRGVLVDVLFADERPDTDKLQTAIAKFRENRTPVYLVNGGSCSDGAVRPQLLRAPDPQRPGVTRAIAMSVPAPRKDDAVDGVTREYYLFADRGAQEDGELRYECSTAALRMHVDDLPSRDGSELDAYREPLVLWWGSARPASGVLRLGERFGDWFAGRLEREKVTPRERALQRDRWNLPFDVYSARQVMDARFDAAAALQDRFVVYGTEFLGATDDVATAIHEERVPGAVVHAMALDNLERWNTNYVHRTFIRGVRLFEGMPEIDLALLALGALLFPFVIPLKDDAIELLAEKAADGRYSRTERIGSAFIFLLTCWLLPKPLVALVGAVMILWVPLGAAFFVAFLGKLLIPLVLAGTTGAVAFWRDGAAPVNFAAHMFVWFSVAEIVDIVKEIQPESPLVRTTFAARMHERWRTVRPFLSGSNADFRRVERSDL